MPINGHSLSFYPVARSVKLGFPLNFEFLALKSMVITKFLLLEASGWRSNCAQSQDVWTKLTPTGGNSLLGMRLLEANIKLGGR